MAVTSEPVVALRPVAGDQLYVNAPDACIVVDEPVQTLALPGTAVTVGIPFTAIARVAVAEQPAALVPVTVYVVVTDGVTVTGEPVVADSPVAGLHE